MSPPLRLRRYRPEDHDRVLELHEEAMRDVGSFVEGVPDLDLEDVRGAYLDGGGEFLVGEADGRIVAMGAFRSAEGYVTDFLDDLPETTAELKRMRVAPDHQRRGYGQRVYEELERRARQRGFSDIVLDTTPKQVGARHLYERNSFEEVLRDRVRVADESFEILFYRKSLD
ncbi:GNAT family N-acetyltransferase [Halopelagius longus]|uniref:GNAT family N-acetyltransferase n=1 Tax=Halopelagius longus TaxID=1236180 RepID=A0A1H1DEB9_9EURY|nr:GNAT family N-acetyltransferase [Halopelagius longus]RDI71294.1 GNAT family N-acetyltransferase [Halopelagius longus]SDQ74750.1 Ribosomal protein S18 acetylase RimI [Halopelagius longus]